MSIHTGHRQRLKERFRKDGLDNFDELYVLELLLFYCIPRADTNPLAHRLLNEFGSLTAVLNATVEELEKIDGIGENNLRQIFSEQVHLIADFFRVAPFNESAITGNICPPADGCPTLTVCRRS